MRPGSLFFVPSPMEGWGLNVLLDRLPPESVVVVMEKDSELKSYCERGFSDFLGQHAFDSRLFWLDTDTEEAVVSLFLRLPLDRLRRCELLTFNGAWLISAPRYRQVFARLEEGLARRWSNRITSMHQGPLWVKNLFDNLKGSSFAPATWPDWQEDPIMVVGAGVTLEETLPWAKCHREEFRLIAVDTALPVLKSCDLVPDAVVCVEAQHANLRDFAGWLGTSVTLFADLTSFAGATRVFDGPPYWFVSEFAPLTLWKRWPWNSQMVPRLPPLGSVGVVAAWIAWKLTKGPVILTGLDFSFPPGKTHAKGSPTLATLLSQTRRLKPMEQPGSWERPGLRNAPRLGWLTTSVMEGYGNLLADQSAPHSKRTWVWKNAGIPLGLPVWPEGRQLGRLGQLTRVPILTSTTDRQQSASWLNQERARWTAILDKFEQLNAHPHSDSVWTELERQLNDVDYLTFSFPDPDLRKTSDWLIRAQVQVRWILNRFG